MSPHGLILLAALLIGLSGKLAFPAFTLRILAFAALSLPLALCTYIGDAPSPLGFLVVATLSLAGAAVGMCAGSMPARLRRRPHAAGPGDA